MEAVLEATELPWGVYAISALARLPYLGEEATELLAITNAGLPVAEGYVVSLSGADPRERLAQALGRAIDEARGRVVWVLPLFPTRSVAQRLEPRLGFDRTATSRAEIDDAVRSLFAALESPDVRAALGGGLGNVAVRLVLADEGPFGRAASADPLDGDPDRIRVWEYRASAWVVDRRSARITSRGDGRMQARDASAVADLVDRVQLAIQRPVEIAWCLHSNERSRSDVRVAGVRPLEIAPRFTPVPYRLVALIAADEGVVCPMSTDALDVALRTGDEPANEARVRRFYARPYRRIDEAPVVMGLRAPASIRRSVSRVSNVLSDLAAPLTAAKQFERALGERLAALDAVRLESISDAELVEELLRRQALVCDSLRLIDRMRRASRTTLTALEAVVGSLPNDCALALAAPRPGKARRKLYDRLARMARKIEDEARDLVRPEALSAPLRKKWHELRRSLRDTRPLGLDMRAPPFGSSDDALLTALGARYAEREAMVEKVRRDAARRLAATARARPLGRTREALAMTLTVGLGRVANAKGAAAEALSHALLRQRSAVLEGGERLAREGLIDAAEDALNLHLSELTQGLSGEPGAYAARVRLRQENDQRWGRFAAPARIERRIG
jgi:hypothetical protein